MTTSATSADLAAMAARAPGVAAARNLRLFDALYMNVPEVLIDDDSTGIEEAIEIAALTGAPFVSLDLDTFDSSQLLDNIPDFGDDDDSPAAKNLQHIIRSARKHNGETEQIWLRWAAMGLSYAWTARTGWRQKLADDVEKAGVKINQESTTRAQARSLEADSLIALLTESPEFRGAAANQRGKIGFAIVAADNKQADENTVERAISRAGLTVERRGFELELKLKPDLDELAEELRGTTDWRRATRMDARREAARGYLCAKADGYRQSTAFVDSLMRAAKYLDDNPPMD